MDFRYYLRHQCAQLVMFIKLHLRVYSVDVVSIVENVHFWSEVVAENFEEINSLLFYFPKVKPNVMPYNDQLKTGPHPNWALMWA